MRIGIIASGSRGDVQPYLTLTKGLIKAGRSVKFVSHENYADLVIKHGIEFCAVPGNVQAVAQSPELTALLEKGKFLAILKIMGEEAQKRCSSFGAGCTQFQTGCRFDFRWTWRSGD